MPIRREVPNTLNGANGTPLMGPDKAYPLGLATTMRMAARPSDCLQRSSAAPFGDVYLQIEYIRRRQFALACLATIAITPLMPPSLR
jgi:hypothetical protein